jgi:putative DNA primase/helicase
MPRFQVLVYPDTPREFVNVDRYPETDAKNRAFAVFRAIDTFDPISSGAATDQDRQVAYIGFEDDAQDFFDDWRISLETRLRSGSESTLLACHLAKYRKLLPALALVFHLIDRYDQLRLEPITLRAAGAAAAWCELLEAHARRVYQSALDGDPEAAMHLAERVKASLPNPFTYRQVAQKGWSGLATVEDVRKAVGVLEDRNWLRVVEVPSGQTGGRPTDQIWVHPAVRGGGQP